jgi:AcrR family transcriptional regulator
MPLFDAREWLEEHGRRHLRRPNLMDRLVQLGTMGRMPGDPTTRRGRASRERIVERAAELFAERGIAATSVDEVLAAAGAGKGQFYHYFRSRDELAAAAVGYRCAQVIAGLTEALGGVSSLAGLEQALAGFVAGFEESGMPGCPIGTLSAEVAGRNEEARLAAAAGFDAWERLLAGTLERMRQRGELRADAEPAVLATGLLAAIEGGMVLSQARRDMASLRIAVGAGIAHLRTWAP